MIRMYHKISHMLQLLYVSMFVVSIFMIFMYQYRLGFRTLIASIICIAITPSIEKLLIDHVHTTKRDNTQKINCFN
jgi:ABC-type bacteriocin/lantibiotic exporter with double-glycine peptidase domain